MCWSCCGPALLPVIRFFGLAAVCVSADELGEVSSGFVLGAVGGDFVTSMCMPIVTSVSFGLVGVSGA